MKRSETVFSAVSGLYESTTTSMGKWMWRNHTQWVASKAKELAKKYSADVEELYCAALLHDLGDSKYERGHEQFKSWSKEKGQAILQEAGFRDDEIERITETIRTHSCRPGDLPKSIEAKVLATADGMWHLQTNFFPIICYMNRPEGTKTYQDWQEWFKGKIERDFNSKIFFEDEREEAREDYEALLRVFGDKTLEG